MRTLLSRLLVAAAFAVASPVAVLAQGPGGGFGPGPAPATVGPTGAGAVQPTFQQNLKFPVLNAAAYGIVCDGITDNTTLLQNLITYAAGIARVYIPKEASPCVSGQLTIPSNTDMTIDGTLLLIPSSTNSYQLLLASGATNIRINGIGTLDGNASNETHAPSGGIGNGAAGVSNVQISGITSTNQKNWPVNITSSSDVHLSYMTLSNSGNAPEFAVGTTKCSADHVTISGITDVGFSFYGGDSNCSLTNSYITGSAIGTSVFNDTGQPAPNHDILIANNIINGVAAYGAAVLTSSVANFSYNIKINDNIIYGVTPTGTSSYGILLGDGHAVTANNNIVHDLVGAAAGAAYGVYVAANMDHADVRGNIIYNIGTACSAACGFGVIAVGSPNYISIVGNSIYDDQATPTTKYGFYDTSTLGTANNVIGNTISPEISTPYTITPAADTLYMPAFGQGSALTLKSLTLSTGALTLLGGSFSAIGIATGNGNIGGAYPASGTGTGYAITTNFSIPGAEVDFWNTINATSNKGFAFLQKTGASTAVKVMSIDAVGNTSIAGVITNPGITTDATHTDATVCEDTTTHSFYSGSGTAGICLGTSSLRFKHNVLPLDVGLPQVMALHPISYEYNAGYGGAGVKYGFAAEQVEKIMPLLVGKDKKGKPNNVDWAGIVPVLVKALQEQQREIADLKRRLH